MPINAVLIDDEKKALEVLELQLSGHCPEVNILACCLGGEEGITAIIKHKPELVFLDIEMPHINGFDVLQKTSHLEFDVIFTTAYDQFTLKAFKYSTIDYLLKPIDISELEQAVKKAAKRLKPENGVDEKMQLLIQHLRNKDRQSDKVALPVSDGMQFFNSNDIVRCESESNYCHIFLTSGKKILLAKTLKEVEENLEGLSFVRIHQSHLINMNHITSFSKADGGYVVMSDSGKLAISRNKKEEFLERFRKL